MPNSTECSAMDLKTISWVGDIYKKFEALFLEVEEETVNYVESQVLTVGESVKKFYSEVFAQKKLYSEVFAQNGIEKKAKANLIVQSAAAGGVDVDIKLAEDIKGENNNLGGMYEGQSEGYSNLTAESAGIKQKDSECTPSLAVSNETIPVVSMPVISSSVDAAAPDMTSSIESSGLLVEDFALISSFGDPSLRSSAWTHINDDRVYQTSSGTSTNTIEKESAERSVVETFDVTEHVVEMVELIDEQQLEGTCVLVEGNKLLFPQQPVKHKSYKKKIREAFCSKKGSTREYEHLVAQHEGQPLNQEAEENVMPTLVAKSNMKLSSSGCPDSEWELI